MAVGSLLPLLPSASLKTQYLALGSAESHQNLALAQSMQCHHPCHSKIKKSSPIIHINIFHQNGVFITIDVQLGEAEHLWEQGGWYMGNLCTFLSVLLPPSPTDLEEQAKWYPSASLQPLAVHPRTITSWVPVPKYRCWYTSQKGMKEDKAWLSVEWGVGPTSVNRRQSDSAWTPLKPDYPFYIL